MRRFNKNERTFLKNECNKKGDLFAESHFRICRPVGKLISADNDTFRGAVDCAHIFYGAPDRQSGGERGIIYGYHNIRHTARALHNTRKFVLALVWIYDDNDIFRT